MCGKKETNCGRVAKWYRAQQFGWLGEEPFHADNADDAGFHGLKPTE
jgi:hypothetical protein